MTVRLLTATEEINSFIAALDEKPEHTVSIHQLRNGVAKVWIIGKPDNFQAAVVQWLGLLEEPIAFGEDAAAIWKILKIVEGWDVFEVSMSVARELSLLVYGELRCEIRHYEDVFYLLDNPPKNMPSYDISITVRLLNEADVDMVKARESTATPIILKSIEDTLRHAVVAGAVLDGKLLGFAESRAADKYVELGVHVDEEWRKKGLATAMAGLLIRHYQTRDLKVTWSTGDDNIASQRVAEKLGFHEIFRRVYVIPRRDKKV
ncbi:MAG: GNAT family N-acetyltransferase [Anaerolineae bacterium]|nr:GNAT family N-acetyltransferase [Anaerolineae bacterium]MDQ7037002.1 GNAT family N-acetyltransferase [Anaerolineae bacterium]